MMRWLRASLLLAPMCMPACRLAEAKKCHEQMAQAQAVVNAVEGNSLSSVEDSIQAVRKAQGVCRDAGRDSEAKQLAQAAEQLEAHAALIKQHQAEKSREKLTPEQLEALVKRGDPRCPRGQAYKHADSEKEIRCTGPQIADMTRDQAAKYFAARGFHFVKQDDPKVLSAEYGAERYVFHYPDTAGRSRCTCLVLYPAPGIPWQEAVSRATSIFPNRLENGGTVKLRSGPKALKVDEKNNVIRIGDCGS